MPAAMASSSPAPATAQLPPEVDLRPLTTSELIDRGFALYRRHFTGLLLLALLSQAAPLLVQVAITKLHLYPSQSELMAPSARTLGDSAAVMLLVLVSQVVIFGFEVVMTFYVADAYLGKAPSVTSSFRRFGGRFLASLWTCALNRILYAITLVFPLLALVAVEFWYVTHPPASFGGLLFFAGASLVLLVASVAPILIVVMRLMVTVPALALEGLSRLSLLGRDAPELPAFTAVCHRTAHLDADLRADDPCPGERNRAARLGQPVRNAVRCGGGRQPDPDLFRGRPHRAALHHRHRTLLL
jgi:hypothetical protein